ncbi:Uncharacterized protein BP5553_04711 [Venustampulla echinocandica]|uniref:DUF1275 domain protein n=1 Tax=Venustampulla echinocandica TaxID=2656787 RepID=A0A370TP40_9HELO|nr:Uncharacterized protein BP5553_04711 [Venustampulla echinocandica]RDL37278.1 Uncharacterized protein BP5553_04711 [Venustampulla echinocandica]
MPPSSSTSLSGASTPLGDPPTSPLPTTEPSPNSNASSTKPPGDPSRRQSIWTRTHLTTEITLEHADIPIIACCFVSGLCDSSSYNAWNCFVSMQTGNTIFLALGASGQPISRPYGWLRSLTSIAFFLLGCLFFAWSRFIRPKTRGTLAASFFLQSVCIVIAAALVECDIVPSPHGLVPSDALDFMELVPLAFLAFQSGGQIVTSRILGFNEVPTTVLTSVYCDIASDPRILARDNVKRNRRVAAVVCILIGGIAGGWISRSAAGLSTNFWIAAAIKMGIGLGWLVWKPKPMIAL